MRKRLFQVIETANEKDVLSKIYDLVMIAVIVLSLIPIAVKNINLAITTIEYVTVVIYIADYILRLITADYKLGKGKCSFLLYPITPMAIIDLLSILPSLTMLNSAFRILKILRLLRALRVFRVFKVIRYSKSINIIINVFKCQKDSLLVVCGLAIGYIAVSALIIFSVEPETFSSFFDAVYWATVSLTTVGYGDIYAVSTVGKVLTMFSSFFGIAIVALPAGIVTAGYMEEINKDYSKKDQEDERQN